MTDLPFRGLGNPGTEYLCFLNSAIQLFLASPQLAQRISCSHGRVAEAFRRVRCASLRYRSTPVSTQPIRDALRRGNLFASGRMEDVAEVVDLMLQSTQSDAEVSEFARGASVASVESIGSCSTIEIDSDRGNESVEHCAGCEITVHWQCCSAADATTMKFVTFTQRLSVHDAVSSARSHDVIDVDASATDSDVSKPRCVFGNYAVPEFQPRTCSTCGARASANVHVSRAPSSVFLLDLAWPTASPAARDIQTLALHLPEVFSEADVFGPTVRSPRTLQVRGISMFRGLHYVSILHCDEPGSNGGWWLTDDESVRKIAHDWKGVCQYIRANRWAPRVMLATVAHGQSDGLPKITDVNEALTTGKPAGKGDRPLMMPSTDPPDPAPPAPQTSPVMIGGLSLTRQDCDYPQSTLRGTCFVLWLPRSERHRVKSAIERRGGRVSPAQSTEATFVISSPAVIESLLADDSRCGEFNVPKQRRTQLLSNPRFELRRILDGRCLDEPDTKAWPTAFAISRTCGAAARLISGSKTMLQRGIRLGQVARDSSPS